AVAEGLVVSTVSERLGRIRRGVMELYATDHPNGWQPGAVHGGELQKVADAVGLRENRYGLDGRNHVVAEANPDYRPCDASNPYFTFDPSQCIVCSRCVRAC